MATLSLPSLGTHRGFSLRWNRVQIALASMAFGGCAASCSSSASSGGSVDSSFAHDRVVSVSSQISPGQELTRCQLVQFGDSDLEVVGFAHRYDSASHHFFLYATDLVDIPSELAGTYDCLNGTDAAMGHARGILYEAQAPTGALLLPPGISYRLAANQVLLLEAHYLNSSLAPLVGHLDMGLDLAPAPQSIHASLLSFDAPFISVPAQSTASATIRCPVPDAVSLISGFTHYHHHGQSMTLWNDGAARVPAPSAFFQTTDWQHPAILRGPLLLPQGSSLRVQCSYQNTSDRSVVRGASGDSAEMCTFSGLYFPQTTAAFEHCEGLSVVGGGTEACASLEACITTCSGEGYPQRVGSVVTAGACWQTCALRGCDGAADVLLQLASCQRDRCASECPGDGCVACSARACPDEQQRCQSQTCGSASGG